MSYFEELVAASKLQGAIYMALNNIDENKDNDYSDIFVLENGMPIVSLASDSTAKYTLNWCKSNSRSDKDFVQFVQESIADRLDYELTQVDRKRLARHYNVHKQ